VGVPVLGVDVADNEKAVETWNGDSVDDRLKDFRERCGPW